MSYFNLGLDNAGIDIKNNTIFFTNYKSNKITLYKFNTVKFETLSELLSNILKIPE